MSKHITRALGAVAIAGTLAGAAYAGTAAAHATPMPQVCVGIEKADSYIDYLVDSWALGVAMHTDQKQQARNIVDSVRVYCPQHLPGIAAAAAALSNQ
jgi:hypothetical protein